VFILAGILFASTKIDFATLLIPTIITILIVASARVLSVYAVVKPLNALKLEANIPKSWTILLSWGSLRGALAMIVVLLVPDDLRVAGWDYAFSIKELLLALVIGCILATLFIKALTIGPLIKKLKIDKPTPFNKAYRIDFGLYYLLTESDRLLEQKKRGFIGAENYKLISKVVNDKINETIASRDKLYSKYGEKLFEQTLRYAAVNVESHYLKELYSNDEINEAVYRKINGKLNLQKEKIEHGKYEEINPSLYIDHKDIFDRLVLFFQSLLVKNGVNTTEEKYQHYRAQSIISRKVVKTFLKMQEQYKRPVFNESAYKNVIDLYSKYHQTNEDRIEVIFKSNKKDLNDFINKLSIKSLRSSGNKAVNFMIEKDMADESIIRDIERMYLV